MNDVAGHMKNCAWGDAARATGAAGLGFIPECDFAAETARTTGAGEEDDKTGFDLIAGDTITCFGLTSGEMTTGLETEAGFAADFEEADLAGVDNGTVGSIF